MKIGVVKERAPNERRVALVPDALKQLIAAGAQILVEKGAGDGAAIPDRLYTDAGASVVSRDELYKHADVVARVQKPDGADVDSLREGQAVVGVLQPLIDPQLMKKLASKKITAISLDAIPRTLSRAQSMDVLSSQANVGGYRAVLMGAQEFGRYFPLLTTAAGTAIAPVQVAALDDAGRTVTTFTGPITISLGANPGGDPLSPRTVNAVNGLATFSNLRIDKAAAGYTLVATANGVPNVSSSVFTIVPGTVTQLSFTVPPSNTPAGATVQPPVQVTAYDAVGNQATNFMGSVVVAIGHNGGLLLPGTLSGGGPVAAVNGVASFSNLSIDVAGNGYTLIATIVGGSVSKESLPFNVTVL